MYHSVCSGESTDFVLVKSTCKPGYFLGQNIFDILLRKMLTILYLSPTKIHTYFERTHIRFCWL